VRQHALGVDAILAGREKMSSPISAIFFFLHSKRSLTRMALSSRRLARNVIYDRASRKCKVVRPEAGLD